jgi:two-component system nitrogen regulation response regulator NtrX
VLITGESGVGKELVARAIHRNSNRADEAFVQVNCAAIPEELIESELFGHEKGSFTGATEKQIGKFELAHRGTIFLDEVGDMSLRTQAKVLRVLQEGEVERIGSQKTIEVDVRVIAATNKNLEEEIARDRFREDLFFRLSVVPIAMPALRERPEDIAPLVEHVTRQFRSENNVRPRGFTKDAVEALSRHAWRGNVRELKNAVERLLIMVEDDEVRPEHLKDVLRRPAEEPAAAAPAAATLRDFKEGAERAFLVQKLRESGWNISATAAAIGTPRSNLYKKLEAYGISQEKDG